MPRGVRKKKEVKKTPEILDDEKPGLVSDDGFVDEEEKEDAENAERKAEEKEAVLSGCKPPHLPGCQCQDPVSSGQARFEDGETGTIVIGEDVRREVWVRWLNGGKGGWVNRAR